MTQNSINYKKAQTEARAQKETERYNKKRERAQNFADIGRGAGSLMSGGGAIGKLITANDPSWYTADTQLTKDAGALSFGIPLGIAITDPSTTSTSPKTLQLAGIAAYRFAPTLGVNTGINDALRNVYAFVRYKNSGHANYEAADLGMYLIGYDSLLMAWATLVRLYGTLKYVNSQNRFTQKRLVEALGFNYDDVLTHINDIRIYVNVLRLRLNAFYIPKELTYYQRHMWLCMNVFMDDQLKKGQMHLFRPDFFFKYNEEDGRLDPEAIDATYTFDTYVALIETVFARFAQSESIGIMAGDILKAYGDSSIIRLEALSEDYTLNPIYSDEVLEQIQNATLFPSRHIGGASSDLSGLAIIQDPNTGVIYQGLQYTGPVVYRMADTADTLGRPLPYLQRLLIAKDDQPSSDRVFTMTRLTATANHVITEVEEGVFWKMLVLESHGSEVLVDCRVYFNNGTQSGVYDGSTPGTLAGTGSIAGWSRAFNSFPFFRLASSFWPNSSIPTVYMNSIIGENVVSVNKDFLDKVHTVAIQSQFGLPYTGGNAKPYDVKK